MHEQDLDSNLKTVSLNKSSKVIICVIPNSWETLRLKEITEPITKGTTPTTEGFKYTEKGINFFRVENINDDGKIDTKRCYFISDKNHESFLRSQLKENDILFSLAGTLGRVALIKKSMIPANINQALGIVRLKKPDFDYIFLQYLLRSFILQKQIDIEKTIGAQPNISLTQLGNFRIIKPSLKEQQKIGLILSSVDDKIQKMEQIIEQTERLQKGLMQRVLTRGIGHTKFQKVKSLFGKVWEIPMNWEIKRFDELFEFLRTGSNSRDDLKEQGDIQYIHYGDIHAKWPSVLDCDLEEIPWINKTKVQDLPFLRDGDLVIVDASEDYEGSGASVLLKNVKNRKIVSGLHTIALRNIDDKVFSDFKTYLTSINFVKNQIVAFITGISVYGITKNNLRKIRIPLPPFNEQRKIASILSEINELIQKQQKDKFYLQNLKKGLIQNLLTGKIRVNV